MIEAQLSTTQILLDLFTLAALVVLLLVSLFLVGLFAVLAVRGYRQRQRGAVAHHESPQSRVTPLGYWSKQQNRRVVVERERLKV